MSRVSQRKRIQRIGARTGLLASVLTLVCGCAAVRVPKLATPMPRHWRNQPAASGAPAPDLNHWWKAFGDPRLDQLVAQSLKSNLDVAQAVERLRAERALYAHADAPFLPSLDFRTGHPVDPDASASYFTLGFDAQWELGLFGRRKAAERAAQGHLDTFVADLRQSRVSLVAEVVRNWIDLRAAEHELGLMKHIRDARKANLQRISVRVKLGLDAPRAQAEARAALADAEAALSVPRARANAAAQRLALLLGRSEPASSWFAAGTLPALGSRDIQSVPADLLRTRPGIARAEADVLQATAALGMARAKMYPDIGIGGSLVWSTSTITHKRYEFNYIGSLGPVISLPLFDWGMRQAQAHARDHQLKASVLAYRKAVLQGIADVETALGNLNQQRAREKANEQAVKALGQAAGQQAERVHLGLASDIEQANSMITRDKARQALVEARAARDIAYVALYKALGGAPIADLGTTKGSNDGTAVAPVGSR
jgi:multidrug efflux system outer membrane protein